MRLMVNKKKFDIGRFTVDLIKEGYEGLFKEEKNSDALLEFYTFFPFDLVRAFYKRYIRKENCNTFYTIDNHCFCENSGHFVSFRKTIIKNFFCNDGKPNKEELFTGGFFGAYCGCDKDIEKKT